MSDCINIFNLFLAPLWRHDPQNNLYLNLSQNKETRNGHFKNLYINIFLRKIFDANRSNYDDKTNWNYHNLENFDSIQLFTKNPLLVYCFHVCS